ncbi:MAG: hypothetical protein CMA63_06775 [Euryarchaeota archaeon]|nr:hypothetical protein [Euryarchaeota archaeon]
MTYQFTVGNRPQLTRRVSAWSDAMYTIRSARLADLRDAVKAVEKGLAVAAVKQHETERGSSARVRALADGIACEVFSMMFSGETEQLDFPAPDTEFVDMIHDAIGYDSRLLATTRDDADMAAVAAARMLSKIAPMVADMKLEAAEKGDDSRATAGDMARAIMRVESDDAAREVESLTEALQTLAPSTGTKSAQYDAEDTSRLELAAMLGSNEGLKKVLELAGRLRRLASADRKMDSTSARSKIIGVEVGRNIPRALPSELALLKSPNRALQAIAMARFASGQMRQYRMAGSEPQGRGPVVVCVDESGSMGIEARDGMTRQQYASACAIAVLGMAQREGRACTVIGFDTRVRWSHTLKADGTSDLPGGCAEMILSIARSRLGGGTDFGPALKHALDHEHGIEQERADLVLITDGYATVPTGVSARLDESRENGMRLYALTVGGGSLSAAVRSLAHEIVDVDTASDKEVASALA